MRLYFGGNVFFANRINIINALEPFKVVYCKCWEPKGIIAQLPLESYKGVIIPYWGSMVMAEDEIPDDSL